MPSTLAARVCTVGFLAAFVSIVLLASVRGPEAGRYWTMSAGVTCLLGLATIALGYRRPAKPRYTVLGAVLMLTPAWGTLAAPIVSCILGSAGALRCS